MRGLRAAGMLLNRLFFDIFKHRLRFSLMVFMSMSVTREWYFISSQFWCRCFFFCAYKFFEMREMFIENILGWSCAIQYLLLFSYSIPQNIFQHHINIFVTAHAKHTKRHTIYSLSDWMIVFSAGLSSLCWWAGLILVDGDDWQLWVVDDSSSPASSCSTALFSSSPAAWSCTNNEGINNAVLIYLTRKWHVKVLRRLLIIFDWGMAKANQCSSKT